MVRVDLTFTGSTTGVPDNFKMVVLDNTFTPLTNQPLPFNTDIPIPTGGGVYNTIFTVPDPGDYYI